MTLQQRIDAFTKVGAVLDTLPEATLQQLTLDAKNENPWFTEESVKSAIHGAVRYLNYDSLTKWTSRYSLVAEKPKTVAVIMAGNIPMVGLHDLISVLIAGHTAMIKWSSKDSILLKEVVRLLFDIEPRFQSNIIIADEKLSGFDAVIATGSDNSSRYFEYYFGKYPNIIRKNRTSCAIITGSETVEELELLADDIFTYFGLGCRNVSKLYIPYGYDLTKLIDRMHKFEGIVNHHKYANNYDYQRSILLVNQVKFLDSGYAIFTHGEALVSPISTVYYETYNTEEELEEKVTANSSKLQCIVGNHQRCDVKFGDTQSPDLWNYADGVDTLKFLESLT